MGLALNYKAVEFLGLDHKVLKGRVEHLSEFGVTFSFLD